MNETIKIADILVGDRLRKDYGDLSDLNTIETVGLIQPLVLVKTEDGKHKLVAGGRRITKLGELGHTEVYHGATCDPTKAGFVYREELPDDVQREIELYENIGRKNMSWQERVLSIAEIHTLKKTRAAKDGETWGQAETGAEVGLTYSSVSYALAVAARLRVDVDREGPFWKCTGLTEALRLIVEERENLGNKQKAELTAKTIPLPVPLNNSNEPEIAIVESLEKGDTITVPLSKMLLHGKMEDLSQRFNGLIDHIITDWPYAIDMDMLDQGKGMDVSRVRAEHDVDDNFAMYPKWLECMYHMLKPKSFCVVWYDNVHFSAIRTMAEKIGFRVQRWPLVWIKTSPCLNQMAAKNWTKATEFAIVLSKQNATLIKPQSTNYWSGPRASSSSNPFAKPKGLWQWILAAFALQGDVVADPFMGEASSLTASIDFGCRVVGFESNENHYNQGITNVKELYTQLTNSNVNFS